MIDDLVRIWPLVIALVFVIAHGVRIESLSRENAKKIAALFDLYNKIIDRELNKK